MLCTNCHDDSSVLCLFMVVARLMWLSSTCDSQCKLCWIRITVCHARTIPDVQLVDIGHYIPCQVQRGNGYWASSLTILVGVEQNMEIWFRAKALLLYFGQVSCGIAAAGCAHTVPLYNWHHLLLSFAWAPEQVVRYQLFGYRQ